ncbi:MAG: prolipoprotein diacylglyceryl transferase [Candidatus Margulisiibacteriota bacterium]
MHPVLFAVGPVMVYSWGFMVAIAFAAGILVALQRAKKEGISVDTVLDICVQVMLASIIGARLFYVIGFPDEFTSAPLRVLAFWEGGMVFYGGLIFAAAALFYSANKHRLSALKCLDIASLSAAIGYSIGRIGCFLRGCCSGVECSLPWAVRFPGEELFVHPTQLYSSLAGLVLFLVLISIYDRKKYDGQVLIWGAGLYCVYRFLNEFVRDYSNHYLGLTASQWISIAVFAAVIIAAPTVKKMSALKRSKK